MGPLRSAPRPLRTKTTERLQSVIYASIAKKGPSLSILPLSLCFCHKGGQFICTLRGPRKATEESG